MKKTIARFISLGLACILIALSLSGCGKPSQNIIGVWKGTIDLKDTLDGDEDEQMLQSLLMGNAKIDLYFAFYEDGEYSTEVDATELKESLKKTTSSIASYLLGEVDGLVETLVDNIMDSVIDSSFDLNGSYKVNDKTGEVYLSDDNGDYEKAFELSGGKLVAFDSDLKLVFRKVK